MELSVCCLGTGRGATAVWEGEPSSAVALLFDGRPVLLVDVGFGVVRACRHWLGTVPDTILITHNHSDHAAELPVVLPLAAAAGRRPRVIAAPAVVERLQRHRLHELRSTGRPLADFCELVAADGPVTLAEGLTITLLRARHSEPSCGFMLWDGDRPLLAYGGDSAFSTAYYARLFEAPTVILDARATGNAEHAGFGAVAAYIAAYPDTVVRITGYGTRAQAPAGLAAFAPGDRLSLGAEP